MNLKQLFLTKNNCYKAGVTLVAKGFMLHSTAADNPNLKRYIGPDDGLLGLNAAGNHWNQPTPDGRNVCVHAFIGKLADGSVATYQTLPWNIRGWHGGSGPRGSANSSYISAEICEDKTDPAYFNAVYQEAIEFVAYLCGLFGWNPLDDGRVICHSEGYERGIATNHSDVMHWFPKRGKTMDDFRRAVHAELNKNEMEDEDMTQEQFETMLAEATKKQAQKPVSDWAVPAWSEATAKKVFDGTMPQAPLTREQAAAVLSRLGLLG
jgi:hypothetical protein